jgi:hypothetical protein
MSSSLYFRLASALLSLFLLGLTSCQTKDFSSMKSKFEVAGSLKMGIIPLENLTPNIKAGEDMARYCYTELFRQLYEKQEGRIGHYAIEIKDEFKLQQIMTKEEWIDQTAHLDIGLDGLADKLGLDLLLIGTVSEYHYKRGLGEDPVVSLHLRLYDRKHETIIWSGSHSRVGHFSWFKEDALGRLAHQVSQELISKMFRELREQVLPENDNIIHHQHP